MKSRTTHSRDRYVEFKRRTMYIKTAITFTLFLFSISQAFSQNLNACRVDFFLLESQESFSTDDNGREYVLFPKMAPDYEIINKPTMSMEQISSEQAEKLKDNKDYNKNNPQVRDSLFRYYSELRHNVGVNLEWWEVLRDATEAELKELKKRVKEYNRKASNGFHNLPGGGTGFGKFWDPSITKPEFIDESTQIVNGVVYQKRLKSIRDDLPIFWIQPKDSALVFQYNNETRQYNFPVSATPVFDLAPYAASNFILKNEKQGSHSFMWKLLLFSVDPNKALN